LDFPAGIAFAFFSALARGDLGGNFNDRLPMPHRCSSRPPSSAPMTPLQPSRARVRCLGLRTASSRNRESPARGFYAEALVTSARDAQRG
jgi:hypothetical protein